VAQVRRLRRAGAHRGMGSARPAETERRGVGGWGSRSVRPPTHDTIRASSHSIVRRYTCAGLLRLRALDCLADNTRDGASAGRSRHPSALAPHFASPGPHRLIYSVGEEKWRKGGSARIHRCSTRTWNEGDRLSRPPPLACLLRPQGRRAWASVPSVADSPFLIATRDSHRFRVSSRASVGKSRAALGGMSGSDVRGRARLTARSSDRWSHRAWLSFCVPSRASIGKSRAALGGMSGSDVRGRARLAARSSDRWSFILAAAIGTEAWSSRSGSSGLAGAGAKSCRLSCRVAWGDRRHDRAARGVRVILLLSISRAREDPRPAVSIRRRRRGAIGYCHRRTDLGARLNQTCRQTAVKRLVFLQAARHQLGQVLGRVTCRPAKARTVVR
jgi:hypothetical protein